ncbi:emp24/gp25L/p24 family of membrane trafficking protein [Scheffersomyces coipomensis]|uniref:emp24/gp25L/p24 family of membrane trafficking protein n=1 Tax=Scheffersomyces coipomensis TaxID=1788519 RepID=UPI00315D50F9
MQFLRFLIITYLLILFNPCHGLIHFYSEVGNRKCFYKELSKGSLLIGKYKLDILDPDTNIYYSPRDKVNIGVIIDVEETFDSNHRVVHQRGSSNGQFTFSSLDSGEHRICITPKSFYAKSWYGGTNKKLLQNEYTEKDSNFKSSRILIDFIIGDSNSIDSSHNNKVQSLSDNVNKLNDKLSDIRREQKFIREKEANFRDLSERTCETVVRWMVIQVISLLITCIYQMISLSKFFIKQKVA